MGVGLLLIALVAALVAAPAAATTVVPMRTRELVASSVAAVRGQVTAIASAADPASGAIATYVTLLVDEVLFGPLTQGELILREQGGAVGAREEWIFGSPEYRRGERVLVFLSLAADGSLHTTGLAMGKYTLHDAPGGARATRDLATGLLVLEALGAPAKRDLPLAALRAQVRRAADTAAPAAVPVHARLDLAALRLEARPAFTLLNPLSRWFEADDGMPIGFFTEAAGDATLGPITSRGAVIGGLSAWSTLPNSPLELVDGGDTEAAPFAGCPDANRVVFNDPFGELAEPRNCRGVLAIGGFCNSGETRTVNGETFKRIITGKVTFNDGWGACPVWTACNLSEIATHELGHALGLGHSADTQATMAAMAHFDGRCAALQPDDEDAIGFVYPYPPSPSATPTVTPIAPPTLTPSRTGTATRTPTRTNSPTRSATPTRTGTATRTAVLTRTATTTASLTASRTATASLTPTPVPSATPSPSPSASTTAAPTPPPTPGTWIAVLAEAIRRLLGALPAAG